MGSAAGPNARQRGVSKEPDHDVPTRHFAGLFSRISGYRAGSRSILDGAVLLVRNWLLVYLQQRSNIHHGDQVVVTSCLTRLGNGFNRHRIYPRVCLDVGVDLVVIQANWTQGFH